MGRRNTTGKDLTQKPDASDASGLPLLARHFIGLSRHRIGIDGKGVTTLAAFHGCPLRCRYCLNKSCFGTVDGLATFTPESLYEWVRIDNLYFVATAGGVCFGGGEPLLNTEFLLRFRELAPPEWHLTVETSLNVPYDCVVAVSKAIDDFIIDVKDLNPVIYRRYTGCGNEQVISNLRYLVEVKGNDHIVVKVPLIMGFNNNDDRDCTVEQLRKWGIENIDLFEYKTDICDC